MSDSSAVEDRPKSKRVGALRGLVPFLWPYRGLGFLALLALVLTASVSLILPLAVRRVIDGFNAADTQLLDQYFGAALVIAGLLAGVHDLGGGHARGRGRGPRGLRGGGGGAGRDGQGSGQGEAEEEGGARVHGCLRDG